VRRAEFFRKGARMRGRGERKTLAAAHTLGASDGGQATATQPSVRLNRRLMKAYLLKEMLERLMDYTYEALCGAILNQLDVASSVARLPAFEKLAAPADSIT